MVQHLLVLDLIKGRKRQVSDIVVSVSATCIEDQSVYNCTFIHSYMYVPCN